MTDESIFVSLERRMKCGVGKCGHCQINGLYACLDGPVFNYADLAACRRRSRWASREWPSSISPAAKAASSRSSTWRRRSSTCSTVVEPVEWREAMSDQSDEYDIAIIEGSITRPEDEERLKEIRARAKVLVALGACATIGGVNKLKNNFDLDEVKRVRLRRRPPTMPHLATAPTKAVDEVVKVDFDDPRLPDRRARSSRYIVRCLAIGHDAGHPQLSRLRRVQDARERSAATSTTRSAWASITRAGCNAPCPAGGFWCFGCRGLVDDPNVNAAKDVMEQYGKTVDDLQSRDASSSTASRSPTDA